MPDNPASEKEQAHKLLDRLEPEQLSALVHLLEVMIDPVARSLAEATVEEEPVTEDEASALDQARASLDRGQGVAHDDVLREFGVRRR